MVAFFSIPFFISKKWDFFVVFIIIFHVFVPAVSLTVVRSHSFSVFFSLADPALFQL